MSAKLGGLTDAEVKAELTKTIMKCTKEVPVDVSELLQLQLLKVPKKTETKCLLACAYKNLKSLNEKGMYDIEHGYKLAEMTKNGDEKRLQNGRKLADICSKINDVEVSDGDKGCERAGLLFKCVVENAPKVQNVFFNLPIFLS
ncbi:unnamed protein product [Parnassius apollo]|uniref:(apollo) hypothetical protein n=1 Tax=Parnassius apollo TaxID=110799 RepID=A0A8S3X1G9_PARAO|nr:unnamed protein product [Parnassius apollo]